MNKKQAGRIFTFAHWLRTRVNPKRFANLRRFSNPPYPTPEDAGPLPHNTFLGPIAHLTFVFPEEWTFPDPGSGEARLVETIDLFDRGHPYELYHFFGLLKWQQNLTFKNPRINTPKQLAKALECEAQKYGWVLDE